MADIMLSHAAQYSDGCGLNIQMEDAASFS